MHLPPSDFAPPLCRMSVGALLHHHAIAPHGFWQTRLGGPLTRLLTFTAAISALVPTSNVAVMVTTPLAAADEVKYSMFSTR